MNSTAARFFSLFLVLLFGVARHAVAQGCRLDYTPNYDLYDNESTSDGVHIYTSVLVDGSTSGNPSAGCNYPTATHTAKAYNMLSSTGGWVTGNPGYMTSYLSVQNDQDIVGVPGVLYNYSGEGDVVCSVFGTFFSKGFNWKISIGVSTLKYASVSGGVCTYTLNCPNGNQNASCQSGPLTKPAPCPYEYFVGDYIVVRYGTSLKCFGVGYGGFTNTPANCQ